MADTLIYLKLDGVRGESTVPDYETQIELESFDWRMNVEPVPSLDKDKSARKDPLKLGEARLSKLFDLSTSSILLRTKNQQRAGKPTFAKAEISYIDLVPGVLGELKRVLVAKYVLQDCFVQEISLKASGSSKSIQVVEDLTLSFKKIDVTYFPIIGRAGGLDAVKNMNGLRDEKAPIPAGLRGEALRLQGRDDKA